MSGNDLSMWGKRTDNVDHRKCAIGKEDNAAANPANDQISNEDMPTLGDIVRTINTIHRNCNIRTDTSHRCWISLDLSSHQKVGNTYHWRKSKQTCSTIRRTSHKYVRIWDLE